MVNSIAKWDPSKARSVSIFLTAHLTVQTFYYYRS
jgi:hypothetical protein